MQRHRGLSALVIAGLLATALLLLGFFLTPYAGDPTRTPDARPQSAPTPVQTIAPVALEACTLPRVVAHRGGSEHSTENTINAYSEAWKYGLLEWETDIRFDVNGVPFLMHDATIDRTTTGTGNASAINIAATPVTMNDGQLLKNQTLEKLLALAEAKGATILIEPKTIPTASQVQTTLNLIDAKSMRNRILFDAFSVANLNPFRSVAPDMAYGLVSSTYRQPSEVLAVGPIFNIASSALSQEIVNEYHAAGIVIYAWTLDAPGQWAPQRTWGTDRYVSNNPMKYRAWRDWVCTGETWTGEY